MFSFVIEVQVIFVKLQRISHVTMSVCQTSFCCFVLKYNNSKAWFVAIDQHSVGKEQEKAYKILFTETEKNFAASNTFAYVLTTSKLPQDICIIYRFGN